ncbi:MAG TPA: PQQ-binding-like beta-propeller repeat protein [Pyrinomonadaceae bacterium]|nr:PQQ-binding-like beta-propeller repeat protein [Pyrinomonadaceae bacterium]
MATLFNSFIVAIFLLLPITTLGDWPQWRGPNRDGIVTNAIVPQTWPKTLKEEWKVTVGIGHSSPILSNGKLYVFARQGEDEILLCLDATTGKEIWRSSQPIAYEMNPAARGHGKGPKSTPVVSKGTICTFGISGVLSCHDTNSGKLKWRREFSKIYPNTSPLYGTAMSPVIDNGVLIAHVGGQDKGALTAFDLETGSIKWSNDADGPAYASPMVLTLAGVRQVVTFMQKDLIGVEAATGKALWKIPAKSEYDTNSVTAVSYKDMIIFAREGQGLTAIRLVKKDTALIPQEVWNNKEIELYMNSPVLQDNLLVGLSVRQKGQFLAIDADTGKTVWQSSGRMGENAAILNLAGKALLLLTNEARLIVQPAGAKTYAPVAEYTVAPSPTWAHPLVIGRRIIIKDENTLASLLIG